MYQNRHYHGKKPIYVAGFVLSKPIHSEYALDVMRWIPRNIEDHDPIGGHEIDTEPAGSRGDEEQPVGGKI